MLTLASHLLLLFTAALILRERARLTSAPHGPAGGAPLPRAIGCGTPFPPLGIFSAMGQGPPRIARRPPLAPAALQRSPRHGRAPRIPAPRRSCAPAPDSNAHPQAKVHPPRNTQESKTGERSRTPAPGKSPRPRICVHPCQSVGKHSSVVSLHPRRPAFKLRRAPSARTRLPLGFGRTALPLPKWLRSYNARPATLIEHAPSNLPPASVVRTPTASAATFVGSCSPNRREPTLIAGPPHTLAKPQRAPLRGLRPRILLPRRSMDRFSRTNAHPQRDFPPCRNTRRMEAGKRSRTNGMPRLRICVYPCQSVDENSSAASSRRSGPAVKPDRVPVASPDHSPLGFGRTVLPSPKWLRSYNVPPRPSSNASCRFPPSGSVVQPFYSRNGFGRTT